ncbi:ParM/StbA family protein [Phormidium sp. FACHB-322]|uniref:ParM/StbA family protein n=2 Tax=Cyanobacteriota TaxID=1117 RepID=UPI0016877810|nr:ParM/StbA family protein [Leptolyngbya sp. FACHB-60]MBD1917958.1 ParM/StbA family protein [Phormidium sp. FACHB-77]MBD2029206.1 ParM/StbA family protein [Phormidium sp. FACHB-322]MBD2049738.1 ParM/StbA family protein [Leptolyngbya sp. FACHB-60]
MTMSQAASIPMNQTSPVRTTGDAAAPKENIVSSKSILSVDLGRTSTKTSISRDPSGVVFIPANVKHLSIEQVQGGAFEARATDPLSDIWMVYQGSGYAMGQLAEDFGANLGVGQSKVNDALVKVLACVGYFQMRDEISVVLGLPYHSQDQFEREKEQLMSLLLGPHVMSYRGEPITININKVWVMPEGYGSILWNEVQEKKDINVDFTKLPVAIVDIGHQTTDCIMVDNFRFARGVSRSEAFAMSQFYEQVASQIEGADSQSLALIAAVNQPQGQRFYRPRGANRPTNLDDILPNLKENFSREMCNRLLAWLPERVTDVILTGGGGEFFWEDIQRLLKEAKINAHLATPSRQANALGQYIYGEAQVAGARAARATAQAS